ncbi:MAG TPA: cytochrome c [Chitinophagaceae bacterium]|nr:cytochrome c [Chitinophagaceae bacterium]
MKKILAGLVLMWAFGLTLFAQSSFKTAMIKGKKVYEKNCLTCHQANGGGVPRMNPPLINAGFVKGDKKKLIQWVLKGSVEKVPIDGQYYSNNMPPQASLKDEDIADVLTYIRNSFQNKGSAVTANEVKAERAK